MDYEDYDVVYAELGAAISSSCLQIADDCWRASSMVFGD